MIADKKFMQRCLDLASKAQGHSSPNPMVGCVIVKSGKILSEGFHKKAGLPHAEIEALKKIKFKAQGATLYCNLEPCFHHGKTPPCVHPIIQSGVKRVVIAHKDPNPKVAGRSIQLLKKAGIQVTVGVLEKEARYLNRIFIKWITTQKPYVMLKLALSLDGKIGFVGAGAHRSKWITGPQSRHRVHELRSHYDAILIGRGTLEADNPRLNVRGIKGAKQPTRVILTHSKVSSNYSIFKEKKSDVISLSGNVLKQLSNRGISSVMIEGGAKVARSFLQKKLVDEIHLFLAPVYLGEKAYGGFDFLFGKTLKKFAVISSLRHGPDLELTLIRR